MEFSTSGASILKVLSTVIGVINRGGVSEYSSAIKASVTSQFLVEASNMDVVSSAWCNIENVVQEGSFCVNALALYEIIKKLTKDTVSFKIEQAHSGEKILAIKSGKSKFELVTLDVENYPQVLTAIKEKSISIKREQILFLIDKTKACIYANETRYNINGMLLNIDPVEQKIFGVTTDGHRLAIASIEINDQDIKEPLNITIPKKVVGEIRKIAESEEENIVLDISSSKVTFNFSHSRLTTKLIDAEFPNYKKVIPRDHTDNFTVNTKDFIFAIDKVSSIYLSSSNEVGIRLVISENTMKIMSTKDANHSFDEIPITFTRNTEMQLMCNFLYFKEILSLIDEETVQIFVKDSNYPLTIQDSSKSSFYYIVMPMKI